MRERERESAHRHSCLGVVILKGNFTLIPIEEK
jgi:hypothetical protein